MAKSSRPPLVLTTCIQAKQKRLSPAPVSTPTTMLAVLNDCGTVSAALCFAVATEAERRAGPITVRAWVFWGNLVQDSANETPFDSKSGFHAQVLQACTLPSRSTCIFKQNIEPRSSEPYMKPQTRRMRTNLICMLADIAWSSMMAHIA